MIALVVNSSEKDEIASFYIRQLLGLYLFSIVISFIPIVNIFGWIITLIFWIISLIGAINGEQKLIPLVGVITSYSIHYTKLYENLTIGHCGQALCITPQRPARRRAGVGHDAGHAAA